MIHGYTVVKRKLYSTVPNHVPNSATPPSACHSSSGSGSNNVSYLPSACRLSSQVEVYGGSELDSSSERSTVACALP